jgi:hypothetical protein
LVKFIAYPPFADIGAIIPFFAQNCNTRFEKEKSPKSEDFGD